MTERFRERASDETGAYMVLWALLAISLFVMVAIVIDLSALREDRRASRLAADSAASAGAVELNGVAGSPLVACTKAWEYAVQNLGFDAATVGVASPCSQRFNLSSVCTAGSPVTATVGDYEIIINTPITNGDPIFMKAESIGGDPSQAVDGEIDGDQCDRLGVRIKLTREPFFAGIVGVGAHTTDIHSVALRKTGEEGIPVNLVLLEPKECTALKQSGTGSIEVVPSSVDPSIESGILILSDGSVSPCNVNGNGADAFTIDHSGSGHISVTTPGAAIHLKGLSGPSCTGTTACDQNDFLPGGGITPSPPQAFGLALNRTLVDYKYNCRDSYAPSDGHYRTVDLEPGSPFTQMPGCAEQGLQNMDYVHELVTRVGASATSTALFPSGTLTEVTACGATMNLIASPPTTTGFDVTCEIPGNANVTVQGNARFRNIKNGSIGTYSVSGDTYFDGDVALGNGNSLTVTGNTTFNQKVNLNGTGALTVVGNAKFVGDVTLAGSSALTVRGKAGSSSYPASCRDVGSSPATYTPFVTPATATGCMKQSFFTGAATPELTTGHAFAYVEGNFAQTGGSFNMLRTFVFAKTGASLKLGGGGNIVWTPPTDGPFEKLALWFDSTNTFELAGGGGIDLNGVFFAPEAVVGITGNFSATPQDAQFFSRKMEVGGTGVFQLRPSLNLINIPIGKGTRLIR